MERADGAHGTERLAHLPPVLDEVDVEAVRVFGAYRRLQDGVGRFGRDLGANQTQPLGYPVHVSIHRNARKAQGEEQHAAGGLWAHAV